MNFFEYYFSEYDFSKEETAVRCPFPHHTEGGEPYYESIPSSHINRDKALFHCKVCGKGLSTLSFIAEILGTTYEDAEKISKLFDSKDDIFSWDNNTAISTEIRALCKELGISDEVIDELKLATEQGDEISFPVFMYDKIVDVRSYRPKDRENKIKSRYGATTGMVLPFDIWTKTDTNKWTVLCAGEKDMAVARSNGFNAITLTGGEKALPKFIKPFINRKIAIVYDHDEAGIDGAKALAAHLLPYAQEVKVVTGFHEICIEHGEDITDFFTKYKKTKKDLEQYIKDAPSFTREEAVEELNKKFPLIGLIEASQPKYVNKIVQSNVQIVATYEKAFPVPTTIHATKLNYSGDPKFNKMLTGGEQDLVLNREYLPRHFKTNR